MSNSTKTRMQLGKDGETQVLAVLCNLGIPAVLGKYSPFPYVDIVAWGVVRVEVKVARPNHYGHFVFAFWSQVRTGLKADVLVLGCVTSDKTTYHTFDPGNPVFYHADGGLKTATIYIPDRVATTEPRGTLTPEMMHTAADNWDLITASRERIGKAIADGSYPYERLCINPK